MGFFSEYNAVNKLLKENHQIVFYAESRHYFQYFEKLVSDLLDHKAGIVYVTSDKNDPLFQSAPVGMKVIYVKWMLGFLFSKIKASVMIMTMPDLGNYLFKRSATVGTYVYLFHAAVSTHQQYRKEAFFNYDAIFCTGEYQKEEIRRAEDKYDLKEKDLVAYGYPLFDKIKKGVTNISKVKPVILIAPSWFKGSIFETCIEELLKQLSKLPYTVILRSHPEYQKREKKKFKKLLQLVRSYEGMMMDDLPNVVERLSTTDILITDRSGIALEFAFGLQKPVLFIDTVLKINNTEYQELGIDPLENTLRSKIGVSLSPENLERLKDKLEEIKIMKNDFSNQMQQLSEATFYNSEETYRKGMEYVLSKISKTIL